MTSTVEPGPAMTAPDLERLRADKYFEREIDRWAKVVPEAVSKGCSQAAVFYLIRDAKELIAKLARSRQEMLDRSSRAARADGGTK